MLLSYIYKTKRVPWGPLGHHIASFTQPRPLPPVLLFFCKRQRVTEMESISTSPFDGDWLKKGYQVIGVLQRLESEDLFNDLLDVLL
jgi:hypothetical protein